MSTPRRYELSDFEWSIIQPLLPNKPRGVPRADDRKVLNQTNTYLLDRGNHTGSQAQSTVAGLPAALAVLAPLSSPALTGTPTAPTPVDATSNTTLATTAFVHSLIAALLGAAPTALDTLGEIATQLATDESALGALTTTVAGKLTKAPDLSDLTDAAAARGNLGLDV